MAIYYLAFYLIRFIFVACDMKLLRKYRFVVSEMSGSVVERAKLSGGVVFVEPERLPETCRYYLSRPELRVAIAERGRQLFERQLEADILRQPVERILKNQPQTTSL